MTVSLGWIIRKCDRHRCILLEYSHVESWSRSWFINIHINSTPWLMVWKKQKPVFQLVGTLMPRLNVFPDFHTVCFLFLFLFRCHLVIVIFTHIDIILDWHWYLMATRNKKTNQVTPVLQDIHWLTIELRSNSKILIWYINTDTPWPPKIFVKRLTLDQIVASDLMKF